MARKPLFEDIEDGFLGVSRPFNPSRPAPSTNPKGLESEISTKKVSPTKNTGSSGDEPPTTEAASEKDTADTKEAKAYVCRGQSCSYRGKALHHWKIHARHSGHLSFGCNLVQGDSFTYIPYEGDPVKDKEVTAEPELEKDAEHKGAKLNSDTPTLEKEEGLSKEDSIDLNIDLNHLISEHAEWFHHLKRHRKERSRLAVVSISLVLFHSISLLFGRGDPYDPGNQINVLSVIVIGSVLVSFAIELGMNPPWEDYEPGEHFGGFIAELVFALLVFWPGSMLLQGLMALLVAGVYLHHAEKVSIFVMKENTGVSGFHRFALAMRYQAALVAVCSFLLAAAENYLIG